VAQECAQDIGNIGSGHVMHVNKSISVDDPVEAFNRTEGSICEFLKVNSVASSVRSA